MPLPGYINNSPEEDENIPDAVPPSQNQNPKTQKFLEGLRKAWTTRPTRKELPEKKPDDLFAGGKQLQRSKVREILKKASPNVPGGGPQILREKRIELEKKLFPKKYGQFISREDNQRMMKDLKKTIYNTKDFKLKEELKHEYKMWGKISGYKK